MLSNIITVASQALSLFLMMAVGFVLFKIKWFTETGMQQLTSILLYVVTPCVMISSLEREFDSALALQLLFMAAGSVILIGATYLFSSLLFKKQPDDDRCVLRNALALSNGGFMGIPLAGAVCGAEGVMFASIFVCVFTVYQWVVGYTMMSGKINLRKVILNPGTIGLVIAVLIFVFSVPLPSPVSNAVGMLADVNSPLAMVIIGAHLAKADLISSLKDGRVYIISLLRLVLLPLAALLLLCFIPVPFILTGKITLLIEFAAPTAATVSMLAGQCNRNSQLASSLVAVTTVLSILTMPIIIALGQTVIQ